MGFNHLKIFKFHCSCPRAPTHTYLRYIREIKDILEVGWLVEFKCLEHSGIASTTLIEYIREC